MPPADPSQDQNTNSNPQPSVPPAELAAPATPPADDGSSFGQSSFGAAPAPAGSDAAAPDAPAPDATPAEPAADPVTPPSDPGATVPDAPAPDAGTPPAPSEPTTPDVGSSSDSGSTGQPFVSQ